MTTMELPLFPLNTVLFPGMPVNLHIFEERYKLMINECIDEDKPFGIVLIESGTAQLGPLASPYTIGTTAHITQVQRLQMGRMNILAIGRDRFRVQELYKHKPYLSGQVEMLPMRENDARAIVSGGRRLRPLVTKYLHVLEEAGQLQFNENQLPADPASLAYLAAVILQTDNSIKQNLLESDSTLTLINSLISMYRLEVALLNAMLTPSPDSQPENNPFSVN